jgi:hypothetical protein
MMMRDNDKLNSNIFKIFEQSLFYLLATFTALSYGYALAKVGVSGYENIFTWFHDDFRYLRPKDEEILIAGAFAMMYLPYYFTYFFKNRGYEIDPLGENAHACSLFWLYRCAVFSVLYMSLRGLGSSDIKKVTLLIFCFICLCTYIVIRMRRYSKYNKKHIKARFLRFVTSGTSNILSYTASITGIFIFSILIFRKFKDILKTPAADQWQQIVGNGSNTTGLVFIFALLFSFIITCICTNKLYRYSSKYFGIMHQRFKIGIPISICVLLPLFMSYTYVRYEYVIFRNPNLGPVSCAETFIPVIIFCLLFFAVSFLVQKLSKKDSESHKEQFWIGVISVPCLILLILFLKHLSSIFVPDWASSVDLQMWVFMFSASAFAATWKYIGSLKAISSICGNSLTEGFIKTQNEFEMFEHKYAMLANQGILLFISVFSMLIICAFKPFSWIQAVICLIAAALISWNQYLLADGKEDEGKSGEVNLKKGVPEILALVAFVSLLATPILTSTLPVLNDIDNAGVTAVTLGLWNYLALGAAPVLAFILKIVPRFHANIWRKCAVEAGEKCKELSPSELVNLKEDVAYSAEWKKEFEMSSFKSYYYILAVIPWIEVFLVVSAINVGAASDNNIYVLVFGVLLLMLMLLAHMKINASMLRKIVKLWQSRKNYESQVPEVKLAAINFDKTKVKYYGMLNNSCIPQNWLRYIEKNPVSMRIDNVDDEDCLIINLCENTPSGEINLALKAAQFKFTYSCPNGVRIQSVVTTKAYSMKNETTPYKLLDFQVGFKPETQGEFSFWVAYAYPQDENPSLNIRDAKDNLVKEDMPDIINVISEEHIQESKYLISLWETAYLYQFRTESGFIYEYTFTFSRDAKNTGLLNKCDSYVFPGKRKYEELEQKAKERAGGHSVSWESKDGSNQW